MKKQQQLQQQQKDQSQCGGGSGSGDGSGGGDSSANSTLRSRDSGLSTMSSTNNQSDPPPAPPVISPPPLPPLDQLRSQSLQESSLPPPAANRLKEYAAAAYVNVFQGRREGSSKAAFSKLSSPVRPPLPSTSSSGVASLDSGFGAESGGTPLKSKKGFF